MLARISSLHKQEKPERNKPLFPPTEAPERRMFCCPGTLEMCHFNQPVSINSELFYCCKTSHLNCVGLFATLWTIAHQTALSMGFSRQEYWKGLPCPPPGIFPTQELNRGLLCCRQSLPAGLPRKPSRWPYSPPVLSPPFPLGF